MIKLFQSFWEGVKSFFVPDQYYSWKTIIYLSLFSWAMSWLALGLGATQPTIWLLTTLSWMFLAFGVGWGLQANKVKLFGIPIAPWVAGAIVCIFLFGSWPGDQWSIALGFWPIMSALIIAVPQFLNWDFSVKVPPPAARQQLILVLMLSLLFSCWFQFYFRLQAWMRDYPSLLADSFDNSGFVYRIPGQPLPLSEGVTLLTMMEASVQSKISNRPWAWVERWLLNIDDQMTEINREVRDRLVSPTQEIGLWRLDMQPYSRGDGYELKMRAIWRGPTSKEEGYYLEKTCQLQPVSRFPNTQLDTFSDGTAAQPEPANAILWANLSCGLETPRLPGPAPE